MRHQVLWGRWQELSPRDSNEGGLEFRLSCPITFFFRLNLLFDGKGVGCSNDAGELPGPFPESTALTQKTRGGERACGHEPRGTGTDECGPAVQTGCKERWAACGFHRGRPSAPPSADAEIASHDTQAAGEVLLRVTL